MECNSDLILRYNIMIISFFDSFHFFYPIRIFHPGIRIGKTWIKIEHYNRDKGI